MKAKAKKSRRHKFQARFSVARISSLNNVSRQSFWQWRAEYIDKPLREAGLQPPQTLSLQACWSISIGRSVRRDGFSAETGQSVYQLLSGFTPAYIEKSFSEGKSCIVLIDHIASGLHRKNFFEDMKTVLFEMKNAGHKLKILVVDTKPLLEQMMALAEDESDRV